MVSKISNKLDNMLDNFKIILMPTRSRYYNRNLDSIYRPRENVEYNKLLQECGFNEVYAEKVLSYGNGLSKGEVYTIVGLMKSSKNKSDDQQIISELINYGYTPVFMKSIYENNYKRHGKTLNDTLKDIKNITNKLNPNNNIIERVNYLENNYLTFEKTLELASKINPMTKNQYNLESLVNAIKVVESENLKGLPISAYFGMTEGIARIEDALQLNGSGRITNEGYTAILKASSKLYKSNTNMADLVYEVAEFYINEILKYGEKDAIKILNKLTTKTVKNNKYGINGVSEMKRIFKS